MLQTVRASTRHFLYNPNCLLRRTSPTAAGGLLQQRAGRRWGERGTRLFSSRSSSKQGALAGINASLKDGFIPPSHVEVRERAQRLPIACPGCGALSQTVDDDAAGFYGSTRVQKAIKKTAEQQREDAVYEKAREAMASQGVPIPEQHLKAATEQHSPQVTVCDRCHYLRYQSRGASIIHPSMDSIQQIIEESPHKHNTIYHVLDAADFPLSLIPNLQRALRLPELRTQNRRSKTVQYVRGRMAEVSFIITRADLLAPKKDQVDSLLPYLREVLRETLAKSGKDNFRLGNVRLVSAQRGWWTKDVKEQIWSRGGAGWMVGKVNVGKSALFEVVFPKGRNQPDVGVQRIRRQEKQTLEDQSVKHQDPLSEDSIELLQESLFADSSAELSEPQERSEAAAADAGNVKPDEKEDGRTLDQATASADSLDTSNEPYDNTSAQAVEAGSYQDSEHGLDSQHSGEVEADTYFDEDLDGSLLPPARLETAYPDMPTVSALPGTTAAPIRIPFGNGKGELIDLPGIYRSSLDKHVKPEHRKQLIMASRVAPEQHTIKPGGSLLLGGLIRIAPNSDGLTFLAYPFVLPKAHVTTNEKATAIQTGFHTDGNPYTGAIESIATDEAKQSMKSAGTFKLEWDVTKLRSGPVTRKDAGKQRTADLPWTIYSADILIEGVGWVELTCQVRKQRIKSFLTETVNDAFGDEIVEREVALVPEVEVFTPQGKFVAVRKPMNAWILNGPKPVPIHAGRARPRSSMNYKKRMVGGALGRGPEKREVSGNDDRNRKIIAGLKRERRLRAVSGDG